jgi:hypothetical protein
MKTAASRSVIISLAWTCLIISTVFGNIPYAAAQHAAQTGPMILARRMARPWHTGSRKAQVTSPPASTPVWTPSLPAYGDPDMNTVLSGHTAVYDSSTNTMIVFGGIDATVTPQNNVLLQTNANGSGGILAGTWSDLPVTFVPPARLLHGAVYDQANNRMIIFGGCADVECQLPLNDTWVLSNANGTGGTPIWTKLAPTGTLPAPREFPNAVYDSANNRMIVYSGDDGTSVDYFDVWVLTNANGLGGTPAWIQLTPTGATPDAFDASSSVYDSTTNTMIVFGGGEFANSVWTLTNANGLTGTPAWTNLIANGKAGSPPGRVASQAVYDSANNRMTIVSGNGDYGITSPDYDFGTYSDVWVLMHANGTGGTPAWTQLHPKASGDGSLLPVGRTWFSAVHDSGTNSLIIFGGLSVEASFSGTWVMSHSNGL